jgi:predicted CoA-binding protein
MLCRMPADHLDAPLRALRDARTIAVVGLDTRTHRPAYGIASYLQRVSYRIVPVHLGRFPADEILGERAYRSLRDIPEPVDLVNVFLRSEFTDAIIDDAIAIGAGAIWLQVGIVNPSGLARARDAGLVATDDRCTMVEHRLVARETRTR